MSKKVTIEISDRFDGVLSITAVKGVSLGAVNVSTYVVDLSRGTQIRIDDMGKGWQSDYQEN